MVPRGLSSSSAAGNFRQLAKSPAAWALAVFPLAIHFTVVATGVQSPEGKTIFEAFGLNRETFLAGEVWRILTYGLLHGSGLHVGINSIFLLLVGCRIEHMAGRGTLVKTFIGGIFGGGAGHLLLAPGGSGAPLLVGMSGACVALLVLLTTLSPQSRMMPLPISGKSLGLGILLAEFILAVIHPQGAVPLFSNFGKSLVDAGMGSWFQVGHACHFGGGVAGWLAGRWILRPRITLDRLRRERARRESMDSQGNQENPP